MRMLNVVDGLEVASPCKASWAAMRGDARVRLCEHCDKHVYNIAEMTGREVIGLVARTEGDFCGRLYRRPDGTVLTADCPVGARAFSSGRLHRAMTLSVLGLAFLTTGAFLGAGSDRSFESPPTGPGATFADWKGWARRALGLGGSGGTVTGTTAPVALGKVCPPGLGPGGGSAGVTTTE